MQKYIDNFSNPIIEELENSILLILYKVDQNKSSIYHKMINKIKDFTEIFDLLAIRLIVDKELEECYATLGIIHQLYLFMKGLKIL